MAEIFREISLMTLDLKIQDNVGALQTQYYLLEYPKFRFTLPQKKEAVMGQYGGISRILAVSFNGVMGPGDLKWSFPVNDVSNVTDATRLELVRQLEINTMSGGFAAWVSTNPLVLSGGICGDALITLYNAGGTGVNQTMTAAQYVESTSEGGDKNGSLKLDVASKVVEAWTLA